MRKKGYEALSEINRAIIKFRGVYAQWSRGHNISHNELLVLYTIRDEGYCTQKMICTSYLVPPQTINHVILSMREKGLLTLSSEHSAGREKAFVLTERGEEYARPLLDSINRAEERAAAMFGEERLLEMTRILNECDAVLTRALLRENEESK